MELIKYNDTKNEYLVVDPQNTDFYLNKHNIKLLCCRREGLGADQLIYGPLFVNGKPVFRVFNADGSETTADIEKNSPIFYQYLADAEYIMISPAATAYRTRITALTRLTKRLQTEILEKRIAI